MIARLAILTSAALIELMERIEDASMFGDLATYREGCGEPLVPGQATYTAQDEDS